MSRTAPKAFNEYEQAILIDETVQARPQRMWWYSKGRVFKVQDDENRALSNRVFIALSRSRDDQLICLALCEHTDFMTQAVKDIHAVVRRAVGDQEPSMANSVTTEVGLDLDSKRNLLPHVYLNLEHPYTINVESLKVIPCGHVANDIKFLINEHVTAYERMMRREWTNA